MFLNLQLVRTLGDFTDVEISSVEVQVQEVEFVHEQTISVKVVIVSQLLKPPKSYQLRACQWDT